MSNDLGEQDTREDIRRVAAACETANDTSAAHLRVAEDLRELNMKRYEYERLNQNMFDERQRAQRHHDVLCLVLKELSHHAADTFVGTVEGFREVLKQHSETARIVADANYPPQTEQP